MGENTGRTYKSWLNGEVKSTQREYTQPTEMFDDYGNLVCAGWARNMLFEYDRDKVKPKMRRKEWDFYQITNGRYMVQISFANISLGGYVGANLVDLRNPKPDKILGAGTITDPMSVFLGGKDKYILPAKGDVPNNVKFKLGKSDFEFDTKKASRTIYFKTVYKGTPIECKFQMDIPEGLENLTTVFPFEGYPTRYFMTTKQNCMPCEGYFKLGNDTYEFLKEDSFACLDWGRVNTPYNLVWYWGNGAKYITDKNGKKHSFGFEITWGIGDESNATETCIFYDGKVHKFGAVDVETFPKPDKYMKPWHFVSEDGRFDFTMTPFYDHHNDMKLANIMRMHSHQVWGDWKGTAVLDDGTKLEIDDLVAFCEYVENKW